MSNTKADALAALATAVEEAAKADDYPTPKWWERPGWWRDEFDQHVPMARYVIVSAAQGRARLYRHRQPEAFAESRRASEEKRKAKQAPAKVRHYVERIALLKKRIPELELAHEKGLTLARKENGEPYHWWHELDSDLQQARNQLWKAERHLRDWRAFLATPNAPEGPPAVPLKD